MKSLCRRIPCLLFLLVMYPGCREQQCVQQVDADASAAYADPFYPLALRDRTRIEECIATAPIVLDIQAPPKPECPRVYTELEPSPKGVFPTGIVVLHVHMSLQL